MKDELPSSASSKWQQRSTPDRDDTCHSPVCQDWDNASPQRADQKASYAKRGTYNLPPQNTGTRGGEPPLVYGDSGHFQRAHEDDYSNYHNHMKNYGNHRYNIHDKNLHLGGPNHPHFINGGGMPMPRHEYHYNRNGHPMDRIPYKNFDRDRPRFFNNGFQPPPPHLDRFHRGEPLNCPNGYPIDRRRPPFRVNGRGGNFQNFHGSPPLHRRWSNGDEGSANCQQRFGSYHNSNGYRYRDRSNCGNGHDSGGSAGYEGGSSETQSEPDERSPAQPPVQSIFIDNDQYTKIQTPRQEVIFKKNSNQSASPSRTQESLEYQNNNLAKRSSASSSTHSKNKKNKSESFSSSKADTVSKKDSSNSSKKLEGSRKPETAQQKKNQSDSAKSRVKTGGSKTKSNSKASKKSSPSGPSPAAGVPLDADGVRPEGKLPEGDECFPDSEDEENFAHEAEAVYAQGISDQCEGYHCTPAGVEDPTLAGVIMQQCYPGGPLVAIPVRWASSLDPTLIPGETALTPLDPAFTHLLDPSFQPLDSSKWTATPAEGDEQVPPSVVIPETVIPMQHDASGCPVTVQVKVDEHGTPLQIEPSCLAVQMSSLQHHPTCQMASYDHGFPLHYAQRYYAEDNYRSNSFEYNFDEGLEKRLEQKIDEELAKHYSDEESDVKESKEEDGLDKTKKASKQVKRRDSGDCEETPYDSQYASMSEGSSLPTSPAGELSDSSNACPPNTPSTSGNVSPTSPDILESSIPPLRESSPNIFSGTPNASNSSISMSSASTLCASSSSSTLVSLSSSPVNSGNPSKEASPSSPRTEFSSTETVTTGTSDEEPSCERTPVKCQTSGAGNENGSTDPVGKQCASETQELLNYNDESIKEDDGISGTAVKEENHKIPEDETSHFLERETTSSVTADVEKSENMIQQSDANLKELSPSTVPTGDEKACDEFPVEVAGSDLQLLDNNAPVTDNSEVPEEVPSCCAAANPDDTTTQCDVAAGVETSDAVTAENECVMVDENGVKVTVKQGYIMVPILTPYYDPSVLFGYTAAPSEVPMDQSHTSSSSGRKKKKKQNKRRGMEMNQNNYMDADLYAGEPYVTTPEGFLLPMDPAQLCQYPQPGHLFMPAVTQYPFSVLPPGTLAHQYPTVVDEGFVSVEHTPQLPEHAPEPLCSDCVGCNDASQSNVSNQDDCSKFAPLEEIEKQQIKEILSEDSHLPTVEPGVNMPESVNSEAEVQHSTEQEQSDAIHENPADVMTPSVTEAAEVVDVKIIHESTLPLVEENTKQNEESVSSPENHPENHERTETELGNESIPPETLECISTLDSLQPDPLNEEFTDADVCWEETIDEKDIKDSAICEPSSSISQSSPNSVENFPAVSDSNLKSSLPETENKVGEPNFNPEIYSSMSRIDNSSQGAEVNDLSTGISSSSQCHEIPSTTTPEAESQKEITERAIKNSNHIQSSRIRDNDRLNTSILRCARDDVLESIAEESPGSLSDSSFCSEEPEFINQLTTEMESALSLLHSREEKKELPVTQAVKRWMREVTPEKIFTLTAVDESCVSALSFDECTSSEDEYSEDELHCKDDSKFNTSSTLLNSTQNDISLDESPKNVKGNPFGCAQCSEFCTEAVTKRVANCSPALDVLEDYDGCSSVSSLSRGPLFSNPNSLVSSESSSRTITPSRSLSEVEDIVVVETKTCRCHPGSYKKYYQLTMELDESPSRTAGSQSPSGFAHSQASSSDQVLPLAAEILRSQQHASHDLGRDVSSSAAADSLPPKSSPTLSSATSSGLGSSVATTPNTSPHRIPPHSSAPRFPFILLPPNVGAETGSASLNSIHCCSIM